MLFIIYEYDISQSRIKIIDEFSYIIKKIICNLILILSSYYVKKLRNNLSQKIEILR